MSEYRAYRETGMSHESAVLLESKSIVDEELKHPIDRLSPAELHTVIANGRSDISGIAILLSGVSARLRLIQWLMLAVVVLLAAIAARLWIGN